MKPGPAPILLALLLLSPAAAAHFYLRHQDQDAPRTAAGDGFGLANTEARWLVVAPDLSVHVGTGSAFAVPAGLAADGTWTVRAEPTRCAPGRHDLSWQLSWLVRTLPVQECGPVLWSFNWQRSSPFTDGTIAAYGPSLATLDLREAQEPTVYQGLTPYYNVDAEDEWSPDYEAAAGNSFLLSDRSRPDSDDDGDGVANRADPDAWPSAWLKDWAAARGLPPWVPSLPRAELLAEDAAREVARDAPALAPWLREQAGYASSSTRGEAPHQTPAGATEVLTFRVRNEDASAVLYASRAVGAPQVAHRRLQDVLLHVPAGFTVDAAATRALAPEAWKVSLWQGQDGRTRVLWQTDAAHGLATGAALDLPVQAAAGTALGEHVWDLTLLFGPAAPERRYAFLTAEVVP